MTTDNQFNEDKKYESALQLLFYEGQIAWQINILFIGLNVGIGTIIQGYLNNIQGGCIILLIMSIIVVTINIMWLGTFRRNNKYYRFRMAQARIAEAPSWKLLNNDGYRFSKGQKITIDSGNLEKEDKEHKLSKFENFASNKRAIATAIWICIIVFAFLSILSFYYFIYPKAK